MLFKIHPGNEVQCFVFFLDLTIQIKDEASPLQRVKTLLGPLYCQLHALLVTFQSMKNILIIKKKEIAEQRKCAAFWRYMNCFGELIM